MVMRGFCLLAAISGLFIQSALGQTNAGRAPGGGGADSFSKPRELKIANKPWTGDFDKMLERRVIRVYAPVSRSPTSTTSRTSSR